MIGLVVRCWSGNFEKRIGDGLNRVFFLTRNLEGERGRRNGGTRFCAARCLPWKSNCFGPY